MVVVNFLNKKNEADLRVYQLLSVKFQLFEGVFGASDEVLGSIGSGIDFEKRIAAIYQTCRKQEEIKSAFDQLQLELDFEISEAMTRTRQKLLDNFDDEVREKLRTRDVDSRAQLNRFEQTVSKEEATAKAFDQLANTGKDAGLEAEFAQLQGHSVDAELEALKRERALPRVQIAKELPPASGGA